VTGEEASGRAPAAYAVAGVLKAHGIDRVFLVTGGDLWLWQALTDALAQDKPAVLDVVVSRTRFAPVTTFERWVTRDL
jgi:thiamine pyrophosphate-dependent acetolactate synthase large subunit-like protein